MNTNRIRAARLAAETIAAAQVAVLAELIDLAADYLNDECIEDAESLANALETLPGWSDAAVTDAIHARFAHLTTRR